MNFDEKKDGSKASNLKKNRTTMLALLVLFVLPVIVAYLAYFSGWFAGSSKNFGELLSEQNVLDIEDFDFIGDDGKKITGKEFETLYWWVMPVDPATCDQACVTLNVYTINQTYKGLGKESKRLKPLLVLPTGSTLDSGLFPKAFSDYSNIGVKALDKTHSGLNKDLPANYIYLVDPLGNIFMRYPLVKDETKAAQKSKQLRTDLLRLYKYSRLG